MKINLRLLYLYLFAFVGLLITVVGSVRVVELGLKVLIFKDADNYRAYAPQPLPAKDGTSVEFPQYDPDLDQRRERQQNAAGALSMIIVGAPLYVYHWKTIQKEKDIRNKK